MRIAYSGVFDLKKFLRLSVFCRQFTSASSPHSYADIGRTVIISMISHWTKHKSDSYNTHLVTLVTTWTRFKSSQWSKRREVSPAKCRVISNSRWAVATTIVKGSGLVNTTLWDRTGHTTVTRLRGGCWLQWRKAWFIRSHRPIGRWIATAHCAKCRLNIAGIPPRDQPVNIENYCPCSWDIKSIRRKLAHSIINSVKLKLVF